MHPVGQWNRTGVSRELRFFKFSYEIDRNKVMPTN
jgi:hypothetical protein